jgi:hypothetical protein
MFICTFILLHNHLTQVYLRVGTSQSKLEKILSSNIELTMVHIEHKCYKVLQQNILVHKFLKSESLPFGHACEFANFGITAGMAITIDSPAMVSW